MSSPAIPPSPFIGPKLKTARGRHHIADLDSEISQYMDRDPWALLLQLDTNTGQHSLQLAGRENIPNHLAMIFSDAVHNFRSALDILANDLVALSGATPKGVYFPFANSEKELDGQIQVRMKGANRDMLDLVRAFKPYRGGNEVLRAAHDLDIRDKHIAVMAINCSSATGPLPMRQTNYERIPGDKPNRLTFQAEFGALKTTPINLSGFPRNPVGVETVGRVADAETRLVVASGLPLAGRSVIEVLNDIGSLTEQIVQSFESLCFGSKPT